MATTARALSPVCAGIKRQITLVKNEIKAEEALRRAQAARLDALQHQTPPDSTQIGKIKERIAAIDADIIDNRAVLDILEDDFRMRCGG
jgi:hypothetical protein